MEQLMKMMKQQYRLATAYVCLLMIRVVDPYAMQAVPEHHHATWPLSSSRFQRYSTSWQALCCMLLVEQDRWDRHWKLHQCIAWPLLYISFSVSFSLLGPLFHWEYTAPSMPSTSSWPIVPSSQDFLRNSRIEYTRAFLFSVAML